MVLIGISHRHVENPHASRDKIARKPPRLAQIGNARFVACRKAVGVGEAVVGVEAGGEQKAVGG